MIPEIVRNFLLWLVSDKTRALGSTFSLSSNLDTSPGTAQKRVVRSLATCECTSIPLQHDTRGRNRISVSLGFRRVRVRLGEGGGSVVTVPVEIPEVESNIATCWMVRTAQTLGSSCQFIPSVVGGSTLEVRKCTAAEAFSADCSCDSPYYALRYPLFCGLDGENRKYNFETGVWSTCQGLTIKNANCVE